MMLTFFETYWRVLSEIAEAICSSARPMRLVYMVLDSFGKDSNAAMISLFVIMAAGFFVLRALKKTAFELGRDSTESAMEHNRATADKRKGASAKEYASRKANVSISKSEVARILTSTPEGFDVAVNRLSAQTTGKPFSIPTFIYKRGLPGEHLMRAAVKERDTVARIVGLHLVFYEKESKNQEPATPQEIGKILASSVRSITVKDLDANRRLRKFAGKASDKVIKAATGGASHMQVDLPKTSVDAAEIRIEYMNYDGIFLHAVFKVPTGAESKEEVKTAMERVLAFRSKVSSVDKWDKILTNSSFVENSPFLSLADAGLEKIETVRDVLKFLKDDDPAVGVARATSEMLAIFTQNEGFSLNFVKQSSERLS